MTVTVKSEPVGEIFNVTGVTPDGTELISTLAPLGSEVMVTTPSFDRPFGGPMLKRVLGAAAAGSAAVGVSDATGLGPGSGRILGGSGATDSPLPELVTVRGVRGGTKFLLGSFAGAGRLTS